MKTSEKIIIKKFQHF